MQPNDSVLDDLVRQIVEAVHPLRVLLFGSAARGEWQKGSDVDMLVVVPDGSHCRRTAQQLYLAIKNVMTPFDLIVATPSILKRHGSTHGLVYHYALKEGKELYAA